MYINNVAYETPIMHPSLSTRAVLFEKFYSNMYYINSLRESISKFIDCNTIEFDSVNFQFNIKIKKTSMRAKKVITCNNSIYYRSILTDIFNDFISKHKDEIIRSLRSKGIYTSDEDYQAAYASLVDSFNLSTIGNVSCYFDNIVIIKL